MKKIETLKKNYEFKNVLEKGKFYIGNQIIVYILKNNKRVNRIGIAINSKLAHAFLRNRVKRLIREGYYKYKDQILLGNDIVFIWNKKEDIRKVEFNIIKKDIEKAFIKENILNKEEI